MNTVVAAPRSTSSLGRFWRYYFRSLQQVMRDWAFLVFIIGLPTTIYLFFAAIYGNQQIQPGLGVDAMMMITMGTYGGMGAAISAGAIIQTERSSGWFRQLMLTPLTGTQYLLAKLLVAVTTVVPAVAVVFLAGRLRGVHLELSQWLASFVLLVLVLIPFVLLGLDIALALRPQAAQGASTFAMLLLAMVGGLWFPLQMMPPAMRAVGELTPSYWASEIGKLPIINHGFPWRGAIVIAVWTAVLLVLGVVGYRRASKNARR